MRHALALPVLLSGMLMAGCGSIPTTHYYVLEPRNLIESAGDGLRIGVAPFAVDAPYDQDRIVYRVGVDSAEVGFYAYHRWASPLSRMLPRVVAGAWSGATDVQSIEPVAPGRDYDATLRGRVLALEEVDGPEGVAVRLQLSLSLDLADGSPLWSDTLAHESTAGDATEVAEVVSAMRDALHDLLAVARPSIEDRLRGRR